MTDLFIYGTLLHRPLLDIVLGQPDVRATPAKLHGHAVFAVQDAPYPVIAQAPERTATGLLLRLKETQVARLDYYECGFGYALQTVEVETENGLQAAQVYWPNDTVAREGRLWSLEAWESDWAALNLLAAEEAMEFMGQLGATQMAARFDVILTRAQARLNAKASVPATLRRKAKTGDVAIEAKSTPYAAFFSVEEFRLRHRTHAGAMSAPMDRAAFVSADAATVLPYDPRRDRVMVIEQFRVGAFARGDVNPWSLEAIAGRIDPGETPEATARREASEEAGLDLRALIPLGGYYASPGAKTEFLYSFIGLAELPDAAAGLGGLTSEGEDIRAHIIGFDSLMRLVEIGEAGNAPLIVSALHLARLRSGLRARLP